MLKKLILIRADSSILIGSGHIMRCLTLAEELKSEGADVEFICRAHKGNLIDFIKEKGFTVHILPLENKIKCGAEYNESLGCDPLSDAESVISVLSKKKSPFHNKEFCSSSRRAKILNAGISGICRVLKFEHNAENGQNRKLCEGIKNRIIDWLIVDHYALDYKWEQKIRPYIKKIMVIDDLADRKHDCDLLLDQNFYLKKNRYDRLVPKHCKKLLGPEFALLRKEFAEARKNLRKRTGEIKRILIFFGGSDPGNETQKALEAVKLLDRPDISVDVVIGALNPHKEEIKKTAANMPNTECHIQINNMAELMAKADLAIGAGGSATWEYVCMGLPCIILTIADNQKKFIDDMAEAGYLIFGGKAENITGSILADKIGSIFAEKEALKKVIKKSLELTDGKGSKKVISFIEISDKKFDNIELRAAVKKDTAIYYKWANDPEVRKNSFSSEHIDIQTHIEWFNKKLADPHTNLYILERKSEPVGQIRFDNIDHDTAIINFSIDKKYRGFGIGSYILKKGIRRLKSETNTPATIRGLVKNSNISSAKSFLKVGFELIDNDGQIKTYQIKTDSL